MKRAHETASILMTNEERIECERLLRKIFGEDPNAHSVTPPEPPPNTTPLFLLRSIWPDVVGHLQDLLIEKGEHELAATVPNLWVYDRCLCNADHCATVYTLPRPIGAYGSAHRNIAFWPPDYTDLDTGRTTGEDGIASETQYLKIIDVIPAGIACIEILDDWESR
jgi:hypothetical protein